MRNWIANTLTLGNAFCGMCSILLASAGSFDLAAWLIILAAILDAFDGKAARFFGGGSQFGIYFDSLADMVSFGVAPAVLAYRVSLFHLASFGVLLAFVTALFAAIRLARFCATASLSAHDFVGLSAPLHGCLIASFVVMNLSLWGEMADGTFFAALLLMTSLLMISRLPMPGLPRLTLREPGYNLVKLVFLALVLVFMAVNPPRHTFPVFVVIAVAGFIAGAVQNARSNSLRSGKAVESDRETANAFRGQR